MLSEIHRKTLLDIVRESINHGLEQGYALPVNIDEFEKPLQNHNASFVTLHLNHALRGCMGSLEAYRPLVQDVAENGYAAAFRDPRFASLTEAETASLTLHVSVLSVAEPVIFSSEQELLTTIRPGVDGLILEDKSHRGTFLPSVWESLPEPELFLAHLKQKAGLPTNHWSDTIKISRYQTESFGDEYRL